MISIIRKTTNFIEKVLLNIPEWLISLAIRLVIFKIFWLSVQTKITGWTIAGQHFAFWNPTDSGWNQFYQFESSLIANDFTVYLGISIEFFLSLMILIGIYTRLAALGLFIMTIVIQFLIPSAWWTTHIFWALLLLYLMKYGSGKIALDSILRNR